jgi:hypothetical protein
MRVGYIRVSSIDQHTDRQLDGIEADRVFTDKASAKDTDRPHSCGSSATGTPWSCTPWTGSRATSTTFERSCGT